MYLLFLLLFKNKVMLSEISQTLKDKCGMIPHTQVSGNSQIHRDRKCNGGCPGQGEGAWGDSI